MSEGLYDVCRKWYEHLPATQRHQIMEHLGQLPNLEADVDYGSNGTAWHWWMLAVLPLDPRIQLAMLAMTSYKERLKGLNKVLGFIKNKQDSR